MPNHAANPKIRAFEVIALREFSNFHVLERIVYISDKMPLPSDLGLKEKEEMMECKEMRARVIVKCQP